MNGASDFAQRSSEVRHLVATADLPSAIRKTMDLVRDFSGREHLDEVTVVSMTFCEIECGRRRDELNFEAAMQEKKKIARQLLGLVGEVEIHLVEVGHA
ncbi:MAG: hypothetical protein DVS81_17785 [Candidatus Accumulibacter meliphilus]|jgi:hypothetical protein|uniref:Effector-associated domain-containing protein n=1 Tax=Candidatus Accumulibacter meliphilus TaxID=2211374 RepID=A0A369XK05_9PROT|nr:MAG: hypothetical protein DVS81_17785 [Candidatus Accumulibacter meliphilus]